MPNSAWIVGSTTTGDHNPMPPIAASASDTASLAQE
jgi:hypothetical protein